MGSPNTSDTRHFQEKVPLFVSYIVLGGGAAIFNLPIVLTVLRHSALRIRKEYCILAGLAFADFVEGFATMLAGIYRLVGFYQGWLSSLISPLSCFVLPFSFLWRWSDFATALMLLGVSIDRFWAVKHPVKYLRYSRRYAMKLIATVYGYAFLSWCLCWIYPVSQRKTLIYATCHSHDTTHPIMYQYSKYFTFCASALSVAIYCVVMALVRQRDHHTPRQTTLLRHNNSQRNITVAFGISSVCTLFLDAIPRAFGVYLLLSTHDNEQEAKYVFLINKLNAMANCIIYSLRLWEIRYGMYSLVRCSQLPLNVDTWDHSSSVRSNKSLSLVALRRRTREEHELQDIVDRLL